MPWMRVYWAGAFPPRAPAKWPAGWCGQTPARCSRIPPGGTSGRAALTTVLVVAAIVAYRATGVEDRPPLLLAPFAMGLSAAFLGRYPYGGSTGRCSTSPRRSS